VAKFLKVGEKCKAICTFCQRICPTTILEKDVAGSEEGKIYTLLVAVCDLCGQVVGIPQSQSKKIKDERKN
jgi:formate hydrogenlyase subunit 6/NADH:ubiquinone oxidoreductase subunit I